MTEKLEKEQYKETNKALIQDSNRAIGDDFENIDLKSYVTISNQWISDLIEIRLKELEGAELEKHVLSIPQEILDSSNPINAILSEIEGGIADFTLLTLSLCSKIYEKHLQILIPLQETTPDIGGTIRRVNHEFVPTVKTVAFLLGDSSDYSDNYDSILQSRLIKEEIVELIKPDEQADIKNHIIRLNDKYLRYITKGKKPEIGLTPDFPAQLLKTNKTFDELILKETSKRQLDDILIYAKHHKDFFSREGNSSKKGFIGLFWGPPGTGKSLTASVIGNSLGIEVYRVDLSRIVSKYIGETEKNLERVFQRFDNKNCILFFDEADALFGKRSDVKEAKDRYANQEVSYLLQRIEVFSGLVILASNLKENMDEAFKRRILSYVHFPRPDYEERLKLWNIHLPKGFEFESERVVNAIAEQYSLTGSHIANIIKLSCLRALADNSTIITAQIIEPYIADIYKREGLQKAPQRINNMQRR